MLGRSDWLETRKLYIINSYINRIAQRSLESINIRRWNKIKMDREQIRIVKIAKIKALKMHVDETYNKWKR